MVRAKKYTQAGFSLIEVSIVLVIIGLVVGVVFGGQHLIRAAKVRSVATEMQQYTAAAITFREKYNYWPGDLPTAILYWPTVRNVGNGNGYLEYFWGESLLAWNHLSLSKTIPGFYDGISVGSPGWYLIAGKSLPWAGYGNSTVWMFDAGYSAYCTTPTLSSRIYLMLATWNEAAGQSGGGHPNLSSPPLTTAEAYDLDTKFDDGMPGTGKMGPYNNWGGNHCNVGLAACVTGSPTRYDLSQAKPSCQFATYLDYYW